MDNNELDKTTTATAEEAATEARHESTFHDEAKKFFNKHDIFLIPNLITYFRIICIPVFMVLCLYGNSRGEHPYLFWSLGVFAVAAASDLVDGKIARKYNMVSDIGKVFDPLADKVMHIAVVLSLTIIGFVPWYIVAFLFAKEMFMGAMSPVLVSKKIVIPAVMAGKVASAEISFAVIAAFFHQLFVDNGIYLVKETFTPDWFMLIIGCLLACYALGTYVGIVLKKYKVYKERLDKGEIDKFGNLIDENGNIIEETKFSI